MEYVIKDALPFVRYDLSFEFYNIINGKGFWSKVDVSNKIFKTTAGV